MDVWKASGLYVVHQQCCQGSEAWQTLDVIFFFRGVNVWQETRRRLAERFEHLDVNVGFSVLTRFNHIVRSLSCTCSDIGRELLLGYLHL